MKLPFTTEQFFDVFARYNDGVWPMQVALYLLALAAIGLVIIDRQPVARGIAAIMAILWAWMAVVYQMLYFTAINPAAWVFGIVFLAYALQWLWSGVLKARVTFRFISGRRATAGTVCISFALLIYPALTWWAGQHFPFTPTFGLPCPTTIFTFGMLLISDAPRGMFVIPLLWRAIGTVAAFKLGVYQDLGLLAAGSVALMLSFPGSDRTRHSI